MTPLSRGSIRSHVPLFVGFFFTGMVTTVLGPVLPALVTTWQLSDRAAGALFTAQFLGGMVAGAASGHLVLRAGTRRTLTLGYVMMAAGLLALCAPKYRLGLAGAAIVGLGQGLVIPTSNLTVALLDPARAASALGAINTAWGIGAALWPLFVAAAAKTAGTRAALVALAAVVGLTGALIYSRPDVAAGRGSAGSARPPISPFRLIVFACALVIYTGVETAVGGWLPEYMRRVRATSSPADWAATGTAFWSGLSAGRALVAFRLDKRYESATIFGGLAIVTACLSLLIQTDSGMAIRAAAAFSGLGLGPVFPITGAALSREVPIRIAGPMIALGSLGAAIIPWLVGFVSDRTGSLASGVMTLLVGTLILISLHVVRIVRAPPSP